MPSKSLADLEPTPRAKVEQLLAFARSKGYSPEVLSTRRTCAEQDALYALGRTSPGAIVTHARGCVSWHVLGRAVDVYLGSAAAAEDYAVLGSYWHSIGGTWGGTFPGFADVGHFEYHPGVHIEQVCVDPTNCTIAPYPGEAGPVPGNAPSGGASGSAAVPAALGALAFLGTMAVGWKRRWFR
jgi:hypothetical protein